MRGPCSGLWQGKDHAGLASVYSLRVDQKIPRDVDILQGACGLSARRARDIKDGPQQDGTVTPLGVEESGPRCGIGLTCSDLVDSRPGQRETFQLPTAGWRRRLIGISQGVDLRNLAGRHDR